MVLREHIQQDQIAFTDWRRSYGPRLVVGIATVGIYRHNGRIVGHQTLTCESLHEPLLDLVFCGPAIPDAASNFLKRLGSDGIYCLRGGEMCLNLFRRPGRFEVGDQVAGADHSLAKAANQIDGARVDQRNRKHQIVGRVLHGDGVTALQHRLQHVE